MSFLENIAAELDAAGVTGRVESAELCVPIAAELEIRFLELDTATPAAAVYIADADIAPADTADEATLVAVVFSAEHAVHTALRHIATDQLVTVLGELLDGDDPRIGYLEFYQDEEDTNTVRADIGENSELTVHAEVVDNEVVSHLSFVTFPEAEDEEADLETELVGEELLELGAFDNVDHLFDAIAVAVDYADEWEEALLPIDGSDGIEGNVAGELIDGLPGAEFPEL